MVDSNERNFSGMPEQDSRIKRYKRRIPRLLSVSATEKCKEFKDKRKRQRESRLNKGTTMIFLKRSFIFEKRKQKIVFFYLQNKRLAFLFLFFVHKMKDPARFHIKFILLLIVLK